MLLSPEKLTSIYWYSAIIGTIVFILKTSIPIETGTEVEADFTSVTDTDASFNLFTIEGIASFFMCSGWMGWVAFTQLHYELKITLVISILSGIFGMYLFTWLITQFKKLEHNPKADINELVGKQGKAYFKFSPNGQGKIQIEFNKALQTLDAVNNSEVEINSFDSIKVIKVENNIIYIEKED